MKKFMIVCVLCTLFLNVNILQTQASRSFNDSSSANWNETKTITKLRSIDFLVGHFDNEIKIIFSDIDNTILKLDKKNPQAKAPESVKKAVKSLHEAKIPLILATGRAYAEASELAKKIGAEKTYLITQHGSEIWDSKGKLIYQDTIKNADLLAIFNFIETLKKDNKLTSQLVVFSEGKLYSTEKMKLPYNWTKIKKIKALAELGSNATASSICIYETKPKDLKFIQSELKKAFPEYKIDITTDCYCDIVSPTATKGKAIAKLAEILHTDLKNTAALGDSENDISMLNLVKNSDGLAIVVGNAMYATRENANYVTAPVGADGFAKAVEKIIKNNVSLKK